MQNSIYKIKYLLFLSWDWEAWCLTVWRGNTTPTERNTAWNKVRKCFHCLGPPSNLIRPCTDLNLKFAHLLNNTRICGKYSISEPDSVPCPGGRVKANSHIPCLIAKGLNCIFPIWFTQCNCVWFTYTMPCHCHAPNMPLWERLLKATAQHGMGTAWHVWINHLKPNDIYIYLSAALTSRRYILNISTNIHTEYFKRAA